MNITGRLIKILAFILLMSVIYAVGAYTVPDFDARVTPPPAAPPPYIPADDTDPVYTELGAPAVIEYGTSTVLNSNNDPLHAYIRYPQAGNPTDEVIYQWVLDIYTDMDNHFGTGVEFDQADFGEINVQFDSYLIDNRYVGIHLYGEYSYVTTEQPENIFKTFNLELLNFSVLEPEAILNFDNIDSLLQLLMLRLLVEHPNTDGYLDFMDERWLSYLLITHEGIKVFLPRDEFLPDSFGALTVILPYDDLGALLLIRRDAPLPSMPTPTSPPTPTPEPTPTPDPDFDTDAGDGEDGDNGDDDDNGDDEDGDTGDGDTGDGDGENGDDGDNQEPEATPEPKQSGEVDRDRPIIALTFDDGPGAFTDELLDILEQYGVRATFFTVGNLVEVNEEALKRAVEQDCEVAGHSWNHKNMAKMSAEDVRMQIETTQNAIEETTGIRPAIFRPTYGAVSDTMKTVSEELELSIVKWNIDSEDWKKGDADDIYNRVMEKAEDKAIIMNNETYASTVEAYRRIIPELLMKGYQIVTVTELIKITNNNKLAPGYTYYNGVQVEMPG